MRGRFISSIVRISQLPRTTITDIRSLWTELYSTCFLALKGSIRLSFQFLFFVNFIDLKVIVDSRSRTRLVWSAWQNSLVASRIASAATDVRYLFFLRLNRLYWWHAGRTCIAMLEQVVLGNFNRAGGWSAWDGQSAVLDVWVGLDHYCGLLALQFNWCLLGGGLWEFFIRDRAEVLTWLSCSLRTM